MCLYTNIKTPLIATYLIRVWKRLIKTDNGFTTPYQYVAVKVGESLKALDPDAEAHCIGAEGVHAYITQDKAEKNKCYDEVITEWEIPAGAKYWLGDSFSSGEIAATEMKFIKVCED